MTVRQEATFAQRFVHGACLPLQVLMPLWLVVGRWVLDAGGWNSLLFLFFGLPLLFIGLLPSTILILVRGRKVSPRAAGRWTAVLALAVWGLALVLPALVGDQGDVSFDTRAAPPTRLGLPESVVNWIGMGALWALVIGLVALVVVSIIEVDPPEEGRPA